MLLSLTFALMSLAVVAALGLAARRARTNAAHAADYDRAVFRDQLEELQRDEEKGLISPAEAAAARNEVSRRLLETASRRDEGAALHNPIRVALLTALAIPLLAVPLYLRYGAPREPDVPLQARLENAMANKDFPALIARVEKRVEETPDDVTGWEILSTGYSKMERYGDAARAYANRIKLGQNTADNLTDMGEALTLDNGGQISANAAQAFADALKLDPKLPKARFFVALAALQAGKLDEAEQGLTALLADSPADAPWRGAVQDQLDRVKQARAGGGAAVPPVAGMAGMPGPTQEQVNAAQNMSAEDRQAMIRTMVDRLAEKLKASPDDLDGWQRLIRARLVLGDAAAAAATLKDARDHFKDKAEALSALDALAKEANIP
jgi:cytochrome c-type biogenesis protein CcmH